VPKGQPARREKRIRRGGGGGAAKKNWRWGICPVKDMEITREKKKGEEKKNPAGPEKIFRRPP